MKFEANENGKIITSYLEVECGKGRRSDAERLVALEISSSNPDHLSSSFLSTFFPLLSNNIDKKLYFVDGSELRLVCKLIRSGIIKWESEIDEIIHAKYDSLIRVIVLFLQTTRMRDRRHQELQFYFIIVGLGE